MAEHMRELNRIRIETGCDAIAAWRFMRDREILRRRYAYQVPSRYLGAGAGDNR